MGEHTLSNPQEVFASVLARPAHTIAGEHASLVHVWWSVAPMRIGDRVVQAYVDGVLTAVSLTPAQHEIWLVIDRSRPRRIELLAVPATPGDARWRAYPSDLRSWPDLKSAVSLAITRDARLPVDARVGVALDGGEAIASPVWPAHEHRAGFGALLGVGGFGHDDATAPGLGRGELGAAPLGDEGRAFRARFDADAGSHGVAVSAHSNAGSSLSDTAELTNLVTSQLPPAARSVSIDAHFTLRWQ